MKGKIEHLETKVERLEAISLGNQSARSEPAGDIMELKPHDDLDEFNVFINSLQDETERKKLVCFQSTVDDVPFQQLLVCADCDLDSKIWPFEHWRGC